MDDNKASANEIAFHELLKERRKDRFWRNLRFAGVIGLAVTAFTLQRIDGGPFGGPPSEPPEAPYVSLVKIEGMIHPNNPQASKEGLRSAVRDAFRDEDAEGVVIQISSPGGTPVQSELIRTMIKRTAERYDQRVVVVGDEMLTSGAYLIASAADKIYAQPSTLVGSIGVIMSGFGAHELIEELGVERRIYTAGETKAQLDPFLPEDPQVVNQHQAILDDIHDQFIEAVVEGRGDLINGNAEELFDGDYWTGRQAVELGLIDSTAPLPEVLEEEFGTRTIRDRTPSPSLLRRLGLAAMDVLTTLTGRDHASTVSATWHK